MFTVFQSTALKGIVFDKWKISHKIGRWIEIQMLFCEGYIAPMEHCEKHEGEETELITNIYTQKSSCYTYYKTKICVYNFYTYILLWSGRKT